MNDLEAQGWAHMCWSWLAHWAGSDGEVALDHARLGVEICERTGGGFSRALAHALLTEAHLRREAWEDSAAGTQALAITHDSHITLENEPLVHAMIARAHLGAGRIADARPAAEIAVRLSCERGHPLAEVSARTPSHRCFSLRAVPTPLSSGPSWIRHSDFLIASAF